MRACDVTVRVGDLGRPTVLPESPCARGRAMSDGKLFRLGDLVERDPKTRAGPALGVVIDSSLAPYDYRILSVSSYGQGCVRNLWEGHEWWDIARRER